MKKMLYPVYAFTLVLVSVLPAFSQQSFADMMLGNMYGKSRKEVYQYLKSFPIKNDNGELDYSMLEPLLTETQKAHDTVSISNYIFIGDQQADGMSLYFYLGKVYGATISGGFSIGKELTTILGKGKSKKEKVSAYGSIDIVETKKWNTPDFRVVYAESKYAAPTYFEVIYTSISNFIQKPTLKIYMQDGSGDTKPYQVDWSTDSNNVTNHCSSLYKLELVGNVQNLSFVIQCLNGKEVYRKDINQSKGKKVILTYKDLPDGCDPVYIGKDWGMDDNESLQSSRYLFKLFEGEYEHFSGSLYLNDCMD